MFRCWNHGTYQSKVLIFIILLTVAAAFRRPHNLSSYSARSVPSTFNLSSSSLGQIVKGNKIQAYGRVTECRGGTAYLVQIDNSDRTVGCSVLIDNIDQVLCELGGTLYRRRKLITVNARVKIEVHLLSPNKGRIVERLDAYDDLFTASRLAVNQNSEGSGKGRRPASGEQSDKSRR